MVARLIPNDHAEGKAIKIEVLGNQSDLMNNLGRIVVGLSRITLQQTCSVEEVKIICELGIGNFPSTIKRPSFEQSCKFSI